jgi:hypothetical protein
MVQSVDLDAPTGTAPNGQACFYTVLRKPQLSPDDMHVHLVSP